MPGSEMVNARITGWTQITKALARGAIKKHVEESHNFALARKPWQTRTGITQGSFYTRAFYMGKAIYGDIGYMSFRAGYWLENPHDNVYPYGNKNAEPFGTRFQILDDAIKNNISVLLAELKTIYTSPTGFGSFTTTGGNV
jgi:hypothetical protein